jgi:MFS family permease
VSHSAPAPDSGPGVGAIIGRLAPMIYGPTVLFALGEGAMLPLLPLLAAELGANLAVAGLVASALVVGQLMGNIPAGWAVSRIGERLTMGVAGMIALVGVAGMLWAPHIGVLAASVLLIGVCAAAFGLARHSFMATRVPLAYRARALSLLGGTFRLGMFIGPFAAALLLWLFGDEHSALWFFGTCLIACILLVMLGPDPETAVAARDDTASAGPAEIAEDTGEPVTGGIPTAAPAGVFRTMWLFRGVLARVGLAAASLSAVRSARQLVLPLWGLSIGVDAQTLALIIGISGAIDFALFYASGQVMDRFGRLWAALPAMVLMGSGFLALAFTHDGESAAVWFAAFAMVLAVGNGLSSGILLTIGADLAPRADPAPFLGSWRTLTDAGGATTPLLVSAVTAAWSLPGAVGIVGAIGLLGAAGFLRWVPRFVPRTR